MNIIAMKTTIKKYLIHLATMQRKHKICLLILILTCILTLINISVVKNDIYILDNYRGPSLDFIEQLGDFPQDTFKGDFYAPTRGADHILFIESSCAVSASGRDATGRDATGRDATGRDATAPPLVLNTLQACAIESAARANPNTTIYLFYSCPADGGSLQRSSQLVRGVFSMPNVRYWHQSVDSLFDGTPLQEFYRSGAMWWSFFRTSHASDVIRVLLLWKYGGAYFDLDYVVRRPLDGLGANYATAEDGDLLNTAAMRLSTTGVGKQVAAMCVEEIRTDFRGFRFNYNGPGLMTRVMHKFCGESQIIRMTEGLCHGFHVYPPPTFYPVHWSDWRLLYDEETSDVTMEKIRHSHAVHLWNSMKRFSFGVQVNYGSRQPIALLQKQFCPMAYEHNPKPSSSSRVERSASVVLIVIGLFFIT